MGTSSPGTPQSPTSSGAIPRRTSRARMRAERRAAAEEEEAWDDEAVAGAAAADDASLPASAKEGGGDSRERRGGADRGSEDCWRSSSWAGGSRCRCCREL